MRIGYGSGKQSSHTVVRRDYLPTAHVKPAKHARAAKSVQPHTDPIRALTGDPAPGQSALDKVKQHA